MNGHYEPGNVRWVSMKVQMNNKRSNRYIEYNGETRTLQQWADSIGMHPETFRKRLLHGWSMHDALNRPVGPSRR